MFASGKYERSRSSVPDRPGTSHCPISPNGARMNSLGEVSAEIGLPMNMVRIAPTASPARPMSELNPTITEAVAVIPSPMAAQLARKLACRIPNSPCRMAASTKPPMTPYSPSASRCLRTPVTSVEIRMPPIIPPMVRGSPAMASPLPFGSSSDSGTTSVVVTVGGVPACCCGACWLSAAMPAGPLVAASLTFSSASVVPSMTCWSMPRCTVVAMPLSICDATGLAALAVRNSGCSPSTIPPYTSRVLIPLTASSRWATGCRSSTFSGIFSVTASICSCVPTIATGRFAVVEVIVGQAKASSTTATTPEAIRAALTLLSQSGRRRGCGVWTWDMTHPFQKE